MINHIRITLERLEDRLAPALHTWTGSGLNDLWSNPANWDGGGAAPTSGDDVVIPATADSSEVIFDNSVAGGAVSLNSLSSDEPFRITAAPASSARLTLNGAGTFAFNSTLTIAAGVIEGGGTVAVNGALTMTGGTVSGSGAFKVGGLLTWSGGLMTGTGTTNANGGLVMTGSPSLQAGRIFNNAGAATYNGVANSSFSLSGSTFNNLATGVFTVEGNNDTIAGTFNNQGTFIKRAGAGGDGFTRLFLTVLNNSGRVELQSGTLSLEGNGTHTGDFDTAAGTTLQVGGSGLNLFNAGADVSVAGLLRQASNEFSGSFFQAGSSYTVSGATEVISGNLLFDITVNAPTLVVSGGRFGGSGTFNVSGLTTWSGGAMTGTGVTNANGGLIMTGQLALIGGRILNNAGTASYDGVANHSLSNGGTINNLAAGIFTIIGNNNIAPSTFNNMGTLIKQAGASGDGATTFASLRNSGIFELQSGTLFSDPSATNTGTVTVGSSGIFVTVGYGQDAGNTALAGGTIHATGNPGVGIRGGTLTGWGTINAKVGNSGGQVSPGLAPGAIGKFDINGQYNQTAGTLNIEIGGLNAGTQFDQLNVVGAASVFGVAVGGTLNTSLMGGFSPNVGDTFMIMNNDGPFAVGGTFAGLPEGAMFMVGATLFGISYVGGTGNDIVLTALTAANTPPSDVVLSLNGSIAEAGTVSLSGSFTDPDATDSHTVVIAWGDSGPTTTLSLAAGVTTFSADHPYPDDNPTGTSSDAYTISVTVSDAGGSTSGTASLTVNNLPPEVLITAPGAGTTFTVDTPITFTAAFTDAGAADTHTAEWSFAGVTVAGTVAQDSGGGTVSDTYSFTTPGAYTVNLTVADDDGGTGTAQIVITIDRAATTTAASVSAPTPLFGVDGLTVSVVVSAVAAGGGTPTGSVTFYDGAAALGSADLVAGAASLALGPTALPAGPHTILAVYGGGTHFLGSEFSVPVFVLAPSAVQGLVYVDADDDGQVDFGERAVARVTVMLTGTDDLGHDVSRTVQTDGNGIYAFLDLRPSDGAGYTIVETQPAGLADGQDTPGTVNGMPTGAAGNDTFAGVLLPQGGSFAENYNFGEQPAATGGITPGQTATIGFWQNPNGQNLVQSLNGGPSATQLGHWLAVTFPNMYGTLDGLTNADVAAFYKRLFARTACSAPAGPPKVDAQVLATALAVYVTNQSLAATTATAYGFQVDAGGVGSRTVNVGDNGAAFGVANNSTVSVLDLLLAVNARSHNGLLYDTNGNGQIADSETIYRTMANDAFTAVNEAGDI